MSGCSACRAAKAANLAKKITKAIVNPDSDQELIDERLSICMTCPFITSILGMKQCSECSCLLSLKAKLKDEHCPIDRW